MSEAGWHLAQVNVGRIKAPLESPQLADFAYRSGHVAVMRRRLEWFERMVEAYLALWRVTSSPPRPSHFQDLASTHRDLKRTPNGKLSRYN